MYNKINGEENRIKYKRLGIITSGGDCGGLNAVIKGAAQMANSLGIETYIIDNGYAGLYNLIERDKLIKLDSARIDSISSYLAGSVAGNSRVKIAKISDTDKYIRIKSGLKKFSIDGLIIAGGDDTGGVVVDLNNNHIPCIHVPKTMDLDLHTYSVGGDSAICRIARFIEELKTTGQSHNRIMIIEVFGRYAGHTAFRGGIAADADCILIPEIPVDLNIVYQHAKNTFIRRVKESPLKHTTCIIIVSEGIKDATGDLLTADEKELDAFGHKKLGGVGVNVKDFISSRMKNDPEIKDFMKSQGLFIEDMNTGPQVNHIALSYLVRSGYSSAIDVNFGKDTGAGAVILMINGLTGVTVSGVKNGKIKYIAIQEAIKQRQVDANAISFYEQLGICFGRKALPFQPEYSEDQNVWCYL
jgi:6-phosphofructokinase 1